MKKLLAIASFIIIFTMAFGTAQVFAATDVAPKPDVVLDRGGPNPNASDKSDRKETQQAANQEKADVRATEKVERMEGKLAGKKYHFRGEVTEVTATTLSVTLKGGEKMVFALTDATTYKIPTLGSGVTWDKLNVGVQVMVTAVKPVEEPVDPNATVTDVPTVDPSATQVAVAGEFTAVKVQVIPGKPVKIHRVGVVTEYVPGEKITIEAKNDGQLYTFELSEDTKILPKDRVDLLVVGAKVTIISRRDPTGGPLAAQGIVVHPAEDEDDDEDVTPTVTFTATPSPTPTPASARPRTCAGCSS